jgi:hypothetical protein
MTAMLVIGKGGGWRKFCRPDAEVHRGRASGLLGSTME